MKKTKQKKTKNKVVLTFDSADKASAFIEYWKDIGKDVWLESIWDYLEEEYSEVITAELA